MSAVVGVAILVGVVLVWSLITTPARMDKELREQLTAPRNGLVDARAAIKQIVTDGLSLADRLRFRIDHWNTLTPGEEFENVELWRNRTYTTLVGYDLDGTRFTKQLVPNGYEPPPEIMPGLSNATAATGRIRLLALETWLEDLQAIILELQ